MAQNALLGACGAYLSAEVSFPGDAYLSPLWEAGKTKLSG